MKNINALATKLLLTINYILKKNNINFASSLKNRVINILSLTFVISVFAKKNIVNKYKKNFTFNTMNVQVKNLAKNITKCS